MYESSSLTVIYKYVFPLAWGGVIITGLVLPSNDGDALPNDAFSVQLVMFALVMIWLIIFAVRLRRVSAGRSHITIHSFHGDRKVPYKNIDYIWEAALVNPRVITLKYLEPESGESDIILIMPSTTSEMFRFKFLEEHDMTQYIREQIYLHNPNYSRKREPSRWQTFGWFVLTVVGAGLLAEAVSYFL